MQTREDTLQYLLVLLILEGDSKISNYYGALTKQDSRPSCAFAITIFVFSRSLEQRAS